jgi:phosphoglycerol transferase
MEPEIVPVAEEAAGDPSPGARPSERAARLVLASVVVGIVAMLLAVLVLRFWSAPLSVPYDYDGDAAFYLMEVQGLREHGTYLTNPDLGYPYGQDTRDLPQGADNLSWLVLRALATFGGPAVAMNLYYLLTFGVIAGMAFSVLRLLRIRAVIAGVAALLYAFLPYHLLRRAQHLLLASYGFVPLAVLFALGVLSDQPPLFTGSRLRIGKREVLVLAGCAAMGSLGAYYAVFSVLLFMAAGVAAALARRSWRSLWSGLLLSAAVGVVVVANIAPSIWYRLRHGANPEAITRYPSETETYGLRIEQLFAPRYGHRNGLLSRLAVKAYSGPIPSELGQTLGIVGAAGVALLLVVVVVSLVSRRDEPWWEHPAGRTLRYSGMLLLVIVLTGTISGFAFFLSAAGLRDIRAWNRAVVVVGFLGLLAVATVAETWAQRAERRRGRRWMSAVLGVGAALVLLLGWYDQTAPIDGRADDRAAWASDRTLFRQMAAELPSGTPVFQLPLVSFPESAPVNSIQSYDPARGYLHAPSLRWSYGAVRGRSPDWPADLDQRPGADLVAYLRRAGFRELLVDRFGYADGGGALEARLAGAAIRRADSPDGRFAWYELG